MRLLTQRVVEAKVEIDQIHSQMGKGMLIFLGIHKGAAMKVSLINDGPFTRIVEGR